MICHTERILYKYGEIVQIRPLADFHIGNAHCNERKALNFINENPESYFIGLGDLMDSIITSDIKRYRKSSDGTLSDDIIDEQVEKLYEWLRPHKNRILGIGTGNHEDVIAKKCGTNPTKRLCRMLGIEFLGYSWLLKLILSENGNRGRTIIIRGHHGWGGGSRTQGADLTKYSRDIAHWDADVFLYGHVHRKQSDRIPRLGIGPKDKLIAKPKLIGICGSFLRTYSKTSDPTYAEVKGYPPTEIGGLTLNIKPDGKWVKMWIDT